MDSGSPQHDMTKTRLDYIERDVRDINDKFGKFSSNLDSKFQSLENLILKKEKENEERYVRRDLLEIQFKGLNDGIKQLNANLEKSNIKMDSFEQYSDMLKDIKKEREAIKFKIFNYIQQGVFYAVTTGFLIGFLDKFKH